MHLVSTLNKFFRETIDLPSDESEAESVEQQVSDVSEEPMWFEGKELTEAKPKVRFRTYSLRRGRGR